MEDSWLGRLRRGIRLKLVGGHTRPDIPLTLFEYARITGTHMPGGVGRAGRKAWIWAEHRLSRKPVVHYIHVRKTGGTAVRWALTETPPTDYNLRFWTHSFTLADVPKGDQAFFFIRNPVDRYVSAYVNRLLQGFPTQDSPWTEAERQAFRLFGTPNDLAEALDGPTRREALAAFEANRHLRNFRLEDWLISPDYVEKRADSIFFVGWQETLADDWAELTRRMGVDVGLPSNPRAANRTSDLGVDVSLSDRAVANLREFYESDYRIIDRLAELGLLRVPPDQVMDMVIRH